MRRSEYPVDYQARLPTRMHTFHSTLGVILAKINFWYNDCKMVIFYSMFPSLFISWHSTEKKTIVSAQLLSFPLCTDISAFSEINEYGLIDSYRFLVYSVSHYPCCFQLF